MIDMDRMLAALKNIEESGARLEPVLVSHDVYKRLQKAIAEGAKPPHFSGSAEVFLFLQEWEANKVKA